MGISATTNQDQEPSSTLQDGYFMRSANQKQESHYISKVVPPQVVSLVGRRGAGKSAILHSAIRDSWIDHQTRRELLRPALKGVIIQIARQVISKSLISNTLTLQTEPPAVVHAVQELMRPLHHANVNPDAIIVLHEFSVFERLVSDPRHGGITADDGFINAYEVLVSSFPIGLFSTKDYIPSKRELQLCRPPTVTVFETSLKAGVKIVDSPGPLNEQGNMFHEYAVEFGYRTALVHVVGLHRINDRLEEELTLFERTYQISIDKKAARIGLLFNQLDVFTGDFPAIQKLALIFISRISQHRSQAIPLRMSLCSALDSDSSAVALHEMAETTSRNFAVNNTCNVLPYGIIPYKDEPMSEILGAEVHWNRSVFGQFGSGLLVNKVSWAPQAFGLLGEQDKQVVLTMMLANSREGSSVKSLPSSVIFHILSYVVSIGSL
jgi:hypothetical protein